MAQKIVNVAGIGPVIFQKRSGTRSIRLHIQGSRAKVTLPQSIPYIVAERYLLSKKDWVLNNIEPTELISDSVFIGKNHRVHIVYSQSTRPTTRVTNNLIRITLPAGLDAASSESQRIIRRACEKALLQETQSLVVPRLKDLAFEHGFSIKSVKVKRLRSRWGSCDQHRNIILNSYLAQLPWPLIDYVLIHELAHTNHLNHSRAFWAEVAEIIPNYKEQRQLIRRYSPHSIRSMP